MQAPINQCPYCGGKEGFFTKMQARGTIRCNTGFDGEELENGGMYEGLSLTGGKVGYCIDCGKSLFATKDLIY